MKMLEIITHTNVHKTQLPLFTHLHDHLSSLSFFVIEVNVILVFTVRQPAVEAYKQCVSHAARQGG